MLVKFLNNRKMYFDKVIFKMYQCQSSSQLISYNLKLHSTTLLEDLSAELFELMAIGSLSQLEHFLNENDLQQEEFEEFLEELISESTLNNNLELLKNSTSGSENNSTDLKDFHDKLYENGYLFNLHFDITKNCNLKCKHCYHPFEEYAYETELTLNNIKSIIDEAYNLGVFTVVISGGEPTTRPDFFDILAYITSKGMCIDLYTNAINIDASFSDKLKEYHIRKISISLYSTSARIHDYITQKSGSHTMTINAIEILTNHGFQVELKSLMMKCNFNDYKNLMNYANNMNCPLILDTTMTPQLNSNTKPLDLSLDYDQYLQLCNDPDSYYSTFKNHINPNDFPCNAGRFGLYCNSKGDFHPCVSFLLNLGNIHSGLKAAWEHKDLNKWRSIKNKDFDGYNKHSYCIFCPEICAGIAQLENGDHLKCEKSDCFKAKARAQTFGKEVMKNEKVEN